MSKTFLISLSLHLVLLCIFIGLRSQAGGGRSERFSVRAVRLASPPPIEAEAPQPSSEAAAEPRVVRPRPQEEVVPPPAPPPTEVHRAQLPKPSYPKAAPRQSPQDPEPKRTSRPSPRSSRAPSYSKDSPPPLVNPRGEETSTPAAPAAGPSGQQQGGRNSEAMPVEFPSIRFAELQAGVELSVTARFKIEPDGSFEVELVKATGDPRLDRLALETLRKWRWAPRYRSGQPVASEEEVEVDVLR